MIIGNSRKFSLLLVLSLCFLLIGCGGSSGGNDRFYANIGGFQIEGDTKVNLEKVPLKVDDLDVVEDLYQEVGNSTSYKDSLLIAQKYSQGLGANAFIEDNLDTLNDRGLELSNISKAQIPLKKNKEKFNAVLLEYEIVGGLIEEIPLLYVSQLFIPKENDMILASFITEDSRVRSNISNMFKDIK